MRLDEITKDVFKDKLKYGNRYIFYAGDSTNVEALLYSGYHNDASFKQGVKRAIPVAYSTFLAAIGDGVVPDLSERKVKISRDLDTGTYMLYDRVSDIYHLFPTRKDV